MNASHFHPDERRYLRLRDVQARVGLSRSAIYASISNGTFPKQLRIGARAVAWRSDEIAAWIDARCKEPDSSAANGGQGGRS